MENFIVSARKYRPATFASVVGQHSITSTLQNSIKNNHLAQAFLFCGPRGVGKTTCARILAKAINCFNREKDGEACNKCDSCTSFNSGQSLNIYELDAASNNSVDDIRHLIEQVRFAPQLGKFKVYIVDEVHMLSQAAFNAFLKTLEEPPAHAIFILATTEKHKILPTILSRCQKFDFNRITLDDMANHLKQIAEKENVKAETEALHIIAQKADGGLRDALSMFDQLVSFTGGDLTYKAVIENLNILDYDYYFKLCDHFIKAEIPGALFVFNEILSNGFDGHNFISGLAEHFRNLLVSKDTITLTLLESTENIKSKYSKQCSEWSMPQLLKAIELCNQTELQYKSSKNQRLLVELCLMRLTTLNSGETTGEKKNDFLVDPFAQHRKAASLAPPSPSLEKSLQTQPIKASQVVPGVSKTLVQPKPNSPKIEVEKGALPISKGINFKTGQTISELLNHRKETFGEGAIQSKRSEFNIKQLHECWLEIASKYRDQKRINLYNALTFKMPSIGEPSDLMLEVANRTQEGDVDEVKTELTQALRLKLQNDFINLRIVINENVIERKMVSPVEKFNKLAEKNPLLNKLKSLLDLEFEY